MLKSKLKGENIGYRLLGEAYSGTADVLRTDYHVFLVPRSDGC